MAREKENNGALHLTSSYNPLMSSMLRGDKPSCYDTSVLAWTPKRVSQVTNEIVCVVQMFAQHAKSRGRGAKVGRVLG
jgi:hypothetical protein